MQSKTNKNINEFQILNKMPTITIESKTEILNDFFSGSVKLGSFCKQFTDIDPAKNGLYHRMKGYNTNGKEAKLTQEDIDAFVDGLSKLTKDIERVKKVILCK